MPNKKPDSLPQDAWPPKGPRHGTLMLWLRPKVFLPLPWTPDHRAQPRDRNGS